MAWLIRVPILASWNQIQLGDFGAAAAVELVAEDGVADVGQVDADLVGAAGAGQGTDQRIADETLDCFENRDRRPGVRVFAANRFLFAVRRVVADRFVDDVPVAIGHAQHDGQIFLFHFARFELGGERVVGLVVFGDDDHAARFAIEPMDDAGPRRAAAAAECAEVVGECAGECAFPMALGRVNDHAGPLVDDDDRFVLVENRERNVLRRWPFARGSDLIDDDDVAWLLAATTLCRWRRRRGRGRHRSSAARSSG